MDHAKVEVESITDPLENEDLAECPRFARELRDIAEKIESAGITRGWRSVATVALSTAPARLMVMAGRASLRVVRKEEATIRAYEQARAFHVKTSPTAPPTRLSQRAYRSR